MTSRRAREDLARAARTLNAEGGAKHLPPLILMTDERRMRDPLAAARALPKGAAIILRHTDAKQRARLGAALLPIVRKRGLYLIIASDAGLAARLKAHGLHLPEAHARQARHWRALRPSWLITAAAHGPRGIRTAALAGADAVLLAPVFATASHKERAPIGLCRFRLMAAASQSPVYALGGIGAKNSGRLKNAALAGIAAVEALLPDQRE